jgi:predicted Zn-dependent peptidase
VLPSGVRILTEEMLGAPSVAVAASVAVGSRDETGGHFGSTHFLEHLLFKGTERRSARDISIAFDSVGGSSNAATAKEYTSYYARVENAALPLALDLLLDMFSSARIDSHDFDVERTVILEELAMNEDDPEDVAHENLAEALLPNHDLGRPIGGTVETINAVDRESVFTYYKTHYVPQNLVITVAGGVSHERVVELVEAELRRIGWTAPGSVSERRSQTQSAVSAPEQKRIIKKDVAQANVLLGYQSLNASDPERFALGILSTVLGGGMSSRLYQEIREERGLAYSTYCYQQGYSDAGYFGVYAGTSEDNTKLVIELMQHEVEKIKAAGITSDELELALGNISGGLALRFESPLARMNRLLAAEIGTGEYLSISEVMDRFRSVTLGEIVSVANRVFSAEPTLVAVGKTLQGLS